MARVIVVAGVASGVGKTTVTVAVARALSARGLRVALFKCGPDYLDPTYHARAVGETSQNLDGWMMGRAAVRATFGEGTRGVDIAIIEGVMGLFDGASPTSEAGSTAEIAKWLEAPVALVVDAGGMARSVAALVQGFESFDPDLRVAAAIFNRVGSRGHLDLLRKAMRSPATLGGLPRSPEHAFPERHLGLLAADESTLPDALLDRWSETAASWIDLDRLVAVAATSPPLVLDERTLEISSASRCRIGVAYDEAFYFYYADNMRRLERLGAELVHFSPVRDATLPNVDGVYIGGGYPEAQGALLEQNVSMRASIKEFAERGGPVYAECGGLMYLLRTIRTTDGERYDMVGLFPGEAVMHRKLQALGYVEVETQSQTILGPKGTRFRGHQFRYSELSPPLHPPDVELAYSVRRRRGDESLGEGHRAGNVLASYVHAHWASNPRVALELVESCVRFAKETRK